MSNATSALTEMPVDRLADIADNRIFVIGAYFFAFAPWGLISSIDFLSEKWRSIQHTRNLVRMHIICSILPVFYVAVYAEAQRRNGDFKEYGAALVALFFNLWHFIRTLFGNVQVDAFLKWARNLADCMKAIRFEWDDVGDPDSNAKDKPIESVLKVNNSVVDNELGGTDVTVKILWAKVGSDLRRGRFRPSDWLKTNDVWLATVRWCAAWLCSMGRDWCTGVNSEILKKFFSEDWSILFTYLDCTTWKIEDQEKKIETTYSIAQFSQEIKHSSKETTRGAFNASIPLSYEERYASYAYEFEFNNVCSSFPTDKHDQWNSTRHEVSVAFVECMLLANYMGPEKLRQIKSYFERLCFDTNELWVNAIKLLLEQVHHSHLIDDSDLSVMFQDLHKMPIFPCRLQMIRLWDTCSNRRVLQASVHNDNHNVLTFFGGSDLVRDPTKVHADDGLLDIYDYYKLIGENICNRFISYSIVAESVRSFLAEWLVKTHATSESTQVIDWKPILDFDYEFSFSATDSVFLEKLNVEERDRIIWECQRALQAEVSRNYIDHPNLPSSSALIMMFIFALPQLDLDEVDNANFYSSAAKNDEGEARDQTEEDDEANELGEDTKNETGFDEENGYYEDIKPSPSSTDQVSLNLSKRLFRVSTEFAPHDVSVLIRQDFKTHRMTLTLTSRCVGARFVWQDWIDAMVGLLRGLVICDSKRCDLDKVPPRNINALSLKRPNLSEPMLELWPLHEKPDSNEWIQTDVVRVWTGWPPFDSRTFKFELDQWLESIGMDMNSEDDWVKYDGDKEVQRVTNVVKNIVQSEVDDCETA